MQIQFVWSFQWSLIILILSASASTAQPEAPAARPGGQNGPFAAALNLPSLSEQQKQTLKAYVQNAQSTIRGTRQQMQDQGSGGAPDVQQIRKQRMDGWMKCLQGTLTPEQLSQLGTQKLSSSAESHPTSVDTTNFLPLTDMQNAKYKGAEGGLYPDGKNEMPETHRGAGLALARTVVPLNKEGTPASDGKIGLISIGFSNTTQEFSRFKQLADAAEEKNPHVVVVDCAEGAQSAEKVHDPDDHSSGTRYWHETVAGRLSANGLSAKQVEVVWLKEVDPRPGLVFPEYPKKLEQEQYDIVRVLAKRFPNIKLCYISSRTYGGYALVTGSPEPYAYEGGFAVKWLIEDQIKGNPELNYDAHKGPVKSPWLSWGPYMWANGMHKRSDGLFYERSDYGPDGMHPSMQQGRTKMANQLLQFLKTDPTAKIWFVGR